MTVVLKTPWAGHPAGAILNLSDYDELALIRAGVAFRVSLDERDGAEGFVVGQAGEFVQFLHTSPPARTKPARGGRKKA